MTSESTELKPKVMNESPVLEEKIYNILQRMEHAGIMELQDLLAEAQIAMGHPRMIFFDRDGYDSTITSRLTPELEQDLFGAEYRPNGTSDENTIVVFWRSSWEVLGFRVPGNAYAMANVRYEDYKYNLAYKVAAKYVSLAGFLAGSFNYPEWFGQWDAFPDAGPAPDPAFVPRDKTLSTPPFPLT